jgi:cell division protein FtsB
MERSWRHWTLRLCAAALLAVTAAAFPYRLFGGTSSSRVEHMRGELERTRAAARERRAAIAELRREIDSLKDQPGAIEDIARRELGMIMPGELVLRFEQGAPPPPVANSPPAADAPPAPGDQGAGGSP